MGVDPALAVTGWVLLEGRSVKNAGIIVTSSRTDEPQRLLSIQQAFRRVLHETAPEVVAIEGPFRGKNARTFRMLSEARGVILAACADAGIPVFTYAPAQIKKAVAGNAKATKPQVQAAIRALVGRGTLNFPEELVSPLRHSQQADLFDALAAALTHLRSMATVSV